MWEVPGFALLAGPKGVQTARVYGIPSSEVVVYQDGSFSTFDFGAYGDIDFDVVHRFHWGL